MVRAFLISLAALFFTLPGFAQERIHDFDVDIEVRTNGDFVVSESIAVTAMGQSIQRGIFRALPRYFGDEENHRFEYRYDVMSVTRNGREEPYETYSEDNAYYIRIGDPDIYLPRGERQTYEIRYLVRNQVRYNESFDELYWNVTGSYWDFPIDKASVTARFPDGVSFQDVSLYTGALGSTGSDARADILDNSVQARITRALGRQEGFTVSVSFDKGLIDPPSAADKFDLWQQLWLGLVLLGASLFGVVFFYYQSWQRVGRDASRLPVFPHYHPPKGISPAAAHYVYHRSFKGNKAFTASLMDLGVKGYLEIDSDKKEVTFTRKDAEAEDPLPEIAPYQRGLLNKLMGTSGSKTIGKEYDSSFATAYQDFKTTVSKDYGNPYFKWNTGYVLFSMVASLVAIGIALAVTINWTIWHAVAIAGLIIVNLVFMYLMPAQTRKGEKARSEIAGLKLYMEKAEKAQMNSVDPHGDRLPPMSKARYEELLPYAIALDVEKPWTKYFEDVLPEEARNYNPGWYTGHMMGHSLHSMNRAMESSISSGVATASVQPSSSSGGGGGGFSGGGGGGGGGGGW